MTNELLDKAEDNTPIPCDGCGAKEDRQRCIGCFHDFGTPESAWVRKIRSDLDALRAREASTLARKGDGE